MLYATFFSSSFCVYAEVFLKCVSRSGVSGSKDTYSINITRYCQFVLRSCSNLQSHQYCMKVPIPLNSYQLT